MSASAVPTGFPTEAQHPKAQKPKGAAFFDRRVDQGLSALQVTALGPQTISRRCATGAHRKVQGPGSVLSKPWQQSAKGGPNTKKAHGAPTQARPQDVEAETGTGEVNDLRREPFTNHMHVQQVDALVDGSRKPEPRATDASSNCSSSSCLADLALPGGEVSQGHPGPALTWNEEHPHAISLKSQDWHLLTAALDKSVFDDGHLVPEFQCLSYRF